MKPWQESGSGPRGADMGRGGADPRAVWPWGVLTQDQALVRLNDAAIDVRRHPDDQDFKAALAEARARLDAVKNPDFGALWLEPVPLDEGYDEGGAYWGDGEPLWCAYNRDHSFVTFVRAISRGAAVDAVREDLPRSIIIGVNP